MQNTDSLFEEGVRFYKHKNFSEAEKIFRDILGANPHHAHSLHMMAAIGHDVERYDFAEELMYMAIRENGNVADFYYTLGLIHQKQNKLQDALINFQKTINLKPDHVEALLKAATICRDQGAIFRKTDMLDAALHFYTKALALRADEETYENIGYLYKLKGLYPEAAAAAEACLKRYPNSTNSLVALGFFHDFYQEYEPALECYKRALSITKNDAYIYTNMATTLKNMGRLDEAIKSLEEAIKLKPEEAWIYSNLILTMLYASSASPEDLANTSRRFGAGLADKFDRKNTFTNDINPNRKLRIGYVSPDFRTHAVNYFLSPIYECDKDNFEIFAYSKAENEDEVTADLKQKFDHWRDIRFADPDSAADMIEQDKIDILIDLAGHTAKNGLMIFARRPAPIQVTWLGYTATTGMKTMDYRITDACADPVDMTEHLNTETLWRLPHIFAAFKPPVNGPAVIPHPPFQDNGHITFGCFNNFAKVTDPVLQAWARIMDNTPDSKLLLEVTGIKNEKTRKEVEDRLIKNGLFVERVILEPRKKENQFVLYNKIDIALDPFPCVGGTTSMDTLWMGVPFVTLAGRHFGSRMGVSILTNAGMPQLIARNVDEYVSIATDLARDRDRLRDMRHNLRERVEKSPLMDQKAFAKDMESAYRQMWQKWLSRTA